ncbi:MAG: hypothetical protein ACXABY_34605 [Candidatus Thorarchaeota archaeon]
MNVHKGLPTRILREEHRVIERILKILNATSAKLEREEVLLQVFEEAIAS